MSWIVGAPIKLVSTNAALRLTSATTLAKRVKFYPDPANTHVVYIGKSTLDPTASPKAGVGAVMGIPTATGPLPLVDITETETQNGINLSTIYLAGTQDEIIYWGYTQQ